MRQGAWARGSAGVCIGKGVDWRVRLKGRGQGGVRAVACLPTPARTIVDRGSGARRPYVERTARAQSCAHGASCGHGRYVGESSTEYSPTAYRGEANPWAKSHSDNHSANCAPLWLFAVERLSTRQRRVRRCIGPTRDGCS